MFYNGYHFWGMHLIWWFFWVFWIFWIFATPYHIPGQRLKKDLPPLDILKKRFASGQINTEEYEKMRKALNE